MTADLQLTRDGELMVVGVDGDTDAGIEFLDAYIPSRPESLVVADAGRIVVPEAEADLLLAAARARGLTIADR